jgi:hypothetical protein
MNQTEALYEFYKLKPKYRGVEATESMLLTNCPRPVNMNNLLATATRISDKLAVSGDYTRAYVAFFTAHPDIQDCEATRDILDRAHNGDDITANSLEELFQVPSVRSMLPESTKHQEQRAEQRERQRLINEITQGKAQYGAFDGRYGCIKYYPSSHLAEETDERISEIHRIVMEQRRVVGMSGADRRKEAQEATTKTVELVINPATGVEYTAAELKRLNRSEYRRILCTSSGQVKPEVAARITQILKGKV